MEDISQELLEAIEQDYQAQIENNKELQQIIKKIKRKHPSYDDVMDYAEVLGNFLADAIKNNVSSSVLPDGKMYYNIAKSILETVLKENYENVAEQCVIAQNNLNSNAKLGLKAVKPKYNEDRTKGLANYISDTDDYSKREKEFLQAIVTNSRLVVFDSVKENADFHYQSGMSPKIIRKAHSGACKWCLNLAGTYNYEDVKNTGNDVFRKHANCKCSVTYDPADGSRKMQDVHSKVWQDETKIEERKRISLESELKHDIIITGARSITDPDSEESSAWAESCYNQIRAQSTDCEKIAKRLNVDIKDVQKIKSYLFYDKSLYDEDLETWRRFDADAAIAQSWQRLTDKNMSLEKHDYTLINHELYEMKLKKEHPNMSHYEAHEIAQNKYNYKKESKEYYDRFV